MSDKLFEKYATSDPPPDTNPAAGALVFAAPDPGSDEWFRHRARGLFPEEEVSIDDNAVISRGDDNGAWVAAWVWVQED